MRGLSLLEVIIVLAILAMMSLVIYSGTSSTVYHQERQVDQSERLRGPTLALMRISRDLKTAYIIKAKDLLSPSFDGDLNFVGKEDRLDFVSFANQRYMRDAKESDSLELSYYLENDPENDEANILIRRQSTIIDKDLTQGGKTYPLLHGVKSLSFEYLPGDSDEWSKEWDSSSLKGNNRLPRAIKINLEVFYPNAEELTVFSTLVRTELTGPLSL